MYIVIKLQACTSRSENIRLDDLNCPSEYFHTWGNRPAATVILEFTSKGKYNSFDFNEVHI